MINLLAIVVAAEEEAGDPPNPVIPVENEIVWAAIFFFALWAMMKFVLLPPILRAMEERSSTIQSGKDAADAATSALGSARRGHEAALAEARAEANAILAGARAAADERRAALQAEVSRLESQLAASAVELEALQSASAERSLATMATATRRLDFFRCRSSCCPTSA